MSPWSISMQGKDVHEHTETGLRPFTEYEVRNCRACLCTDSRLL